MLSGQVPPVSGHAKRLVRRRGPVWLIKYRAPDQNGVERQYHRLLGPEWEGAGPPPPGFFNKRLANEALQAILTDARRGALELARTGITFAQAADDWMEWGIYQRNWKQSTIADRRSCLQRHLLPAFGSLRIEQISTKRLERWKLEFLRETGRRRQCAKLLALLSSIFERARRLHGLPKNPVAEVDRVRVSYDATRFDFYSPEEVYALARAAATEQDSAIFLTAAFAGLRRGECIALRVPRRWRRAHGRLGAATAVRRRPRQRRPASVALPRPASHVRSLAINRASIVQVQAWMGHADSRTTMRYLHHKTQEAEASLPAGALRPAATSPPMPLFASSGV